MVQSKISLTTNGTLLVRCCYSILALTYTRDKQNVCFTQSFNSSLVSIRLSVQRLFTLFFFRHRCLDKLFADKVHMQMNDISYIVLEAYIMQVFNSWFGSDDCEDVQLDINLDMSKQTHILCI